MLGQPFTRLGQWGGPGASYRFPIVIPINMQLQVAGPQPVAFVDTLQFCQIANAGIQVIVQLLDQNGNPLNISGATALIIAFQQPDGTQFTRTAQYVSTGIDGQIYYVTTAADITEAGLWYAQAQITVGGATLTTQWGQFQANANL